MKTHVVSNGSGSQVMDGSGSQVMAQTGNGSSRWVPTIHARDLGGILGSWPILDCDKHLGE